MSACRGEGRFAPRNETGIEAGIGDNRYSGCKGRSTGPGGGITRHGLKRSSSASEQFQGRSRSESYLPMQKLEKILPSRSSLENSPVMSFKACCA